jgi:hypothetical protein
MAEDFEDLFFDFEVVYVGMAGRSIDTFDHDARFVSFDDCGRTSIEDIRWILGWL